MALEIPQPDDGVTPSKIVESLKGDFSVLSRLIRSLGAPVQCSEGLVTVRAHYLPFRNGKPRTGELLEVIRRYICNFALSRAEIAAAHKQAESATEQERMMIYIKLRDAAADLFIKAQKSTSRNGECGELLLYLLTEWILEAPQIMAKMSLKTNAQMPVHGSDGIHIKYDKASDRLMFFWGEAKMHKSVSSAITSAVQSISSALKFDKLKEDINLVRRYAHLSGLSQTAQDFVVDYLDPLSENYDKKIDASACLIGFDFDGFKKLSAVPTADLENTFTKLLGLAISEATKTLEASLSAHGISHHVMEVFFLPFTSVDQLRIDFQKAIGWKP